MAVGAQQPLPRAQMRACPKAIARDPNEGASTRWKTVEEMGKVLDRLEGRLDRITAVIHSTSAKERLLGPAAAAEVRLSKSTEDSWEDSWEDSGAPVLRSSLERHRIVDVEPREAKYYTSLLSSNCRGLICSSSD
jgi:hypothetical protein